MLWQLVAYLCGMPSFGDATRLDEWCMLATCACPDAHACIDVHARGPCAVLKQEVNIDALR